MNARRIAEIHIEIAKLHQELAEAMTPDEHATVEPVKRRRVKVHPPAPPMSREPTDLEVARAARMLRRRGIAT